MRPRAPGGRGCCAPLLCLLLGAALGTAWVLPLLTRGGQASRLKPPPPPGEAGGLAEAELAAKVEAAAAEEEAQCPQELFARIAWDLRPFQLRGIGLRGVEQAYCQGSRGSLRLQVGGRAGWVVAGWVGTRAPAAGARPPLP